MSRDSAKAHYTKQPGDPDEGFITASDAQAAIDDIYDDMSAPAVIADGSVTSGKIAADAVGSAQIATGAVGSGELATDAVTSDKIADGAVSNAHVASDAAIAASKVAGTAVTQADTGTVTNGMLAGSIAKTKVAGTAITAADTGTVTGTMIAAGAVDNGNLAANAVNEAKIASGAVTTVKIADDAVTSDKIADNAVTAAQIAANAVGASELADNAVDTAAIAADAVTADKIANDTITAAELAANSVGTSELANDSVTAAKILDGTITANEIQNASITGAKLVNDTITATQIAANAVGASELADNAVDTAAIADDAVTAAKIAANAVGSSELADNAVDTAAIADSAVTSAKIADSAGTRPSEFVVRSRNLVPDPQLTVAGLSADSAQYPVTRVTTGALPLGTQNALRTVRQGTLNPVISSAFLTPTSSDSPLRIPVTPGDVMSFAAEVRTTATGAQAELGFTWRTAGGAQVGTVTVSTGKVALVQNACTTLKIENVTVPPTATYIVMAGNVTTISGGNASEGDEVRWGAVRANVGRTISDYIDGSFSGCRWVDTPHASASYRWRIDDGDIADIAARQAGLSTLPFMDAFGWDGSFDGASKAKYGSRFIGWFLDQNANEQVLKTISLPPEWDSADLELWHGNPAEGITLGSGLALSAANDTVTATSHGKADGTVVQLSSIVSATGVSAATNYYMVNVATHTFQLALTPGGSPVDITADGTATVTITHGLGTVLGTGLALSASANTITKASHGLATGAAVSLASIVSATGVSAGTVYYVINPTTDTFQLATATGSTSVVDITADGTATVITLTSAVCVVLNYSVKEPGDNATTFDVQTPNFGRAAAVKDGIAQSDLGYGLVIPDNGIAHLRVVRLGSVSSDTLPNDMAFLGLKARRRQFGDRFDLSKMRVVRADAQNEYIGPHWQDTGGSTYDSLTVLSSTGRTFRGSVSIDANMAAADQLPAWTADETRHAGIMTCFTSANDNYIAMFSVAANQFQVIKQVSNVETVLAKRSLTGLATLALGTPYILEIMADGVNVVASIYTNAGVLIDTVTVADTSFSMGDTGFHVFATQSTLHWLEMW